MRSPSCKEPVADGGCSEPPLPLGGCTELQLPLGAANVSRASGTPRRYAGIAAIASVQLVVVAFLVYAFNESDKPSEPSGAAAAETKKDS